MNMSAENILLWLYRFIVLLAMLYIVLLTSKWWVPVATDNTNILNNIHATLSNIDATMTRIDDTLDFKPN
jgi:hypothetical protein